MIFSSATLITPFFSTKNPLNIACCRCQRGVLKSSKHIREKTADTKADDRDGNYNPYGYEERLCVLLICNNTDCAESYLVVGREFQDVERTYDEINQKVEEVEISVFKPLFFTPTLLLFPLHKSLPNLVSTELKKSFNLFFADFSSAANKIRIALELLMDEFNIPLHGPKGKELDLHSRIVEFKKINPSAGDNLLSIKIVGNSGSHASGTTNDDVVTAYEIIEHVLDELYVRPYRISEVQLKAQGIASKKKQIRPSNNRLVLLPPPPPPKP